MTDSDITTIFDAWAYRTADLAHELSLRAKTLSDRFTAYGLFDAVLVASRVWAGSTETRIAARRLSPNTDTYRPPNSDPAIHELVLGWLAETHGLQRTLGEENLPRARAAADAFSTAAQLVELRLRGYVLRVSESD